jgi:hypothetical protein
MILALGASAFIVLLTGIMMTSPTRDKSKKVSPVKKSPKKKVITSIQVTEADMKGKRKLDYHLRITKLACDFELIYIDATLGNDGFGQKLFDHITNDAGFRAEGILAVTKRRVSLEDSSVMTNVKDTYPRRMMIRSVDEGTSTHASRLAVLRALQAFLVRPENNKFGYAYVVDDASDLTPTHEADLEPMDRFLHDETIVNMMCLVFEGTGPGWYAANRLSALDFFSGPNFPAYAIQQLGYPVNGIDFGAYAPGFNPPLNGGT